MAILFAVSIINIILCLFIRIIFKRQILLLFLQNLLIGLLLLCRLFEYNYYLLYYIFLTLFVYMNILEKTKNVIDKNRIILYFLLAISIIPFLLDSNIGLGIDNHYRIILVFLIIHFLYHNINLRFKNKELMMTFVILNFIILFISPDMSISSINYFLLIATQTFLFYLTVNKLYVFILKLQDNIKLLYKEKDSIYSMLEIIGNSIINNEDIKQVFLLILKSIMSATKAVSGSVFLFDKDHQVLTSYVVEGFFPPIEKVRDSITISRKKYLLEHIKQEKIQIGEGLIGQCAKKNEPLFLPDANKNDIVKNTFTDDIEVRTLMMIPLHTKEAVFGVLCIVNKDNNGSFSQEDFNIFKTLSEQASITIQNVQFYKMKLEKQRMEHELNLASKIQMDLLPQQIPELKECDLSNILIPAKEVGGDYYDVIKLDDTRTAVIIGDVSGKGVPAGIVMTIIRTLIQQFSHFNWDIKTILKKINESIYGDIDENMFMTFLYGIWDDSQKKFTYVSAGHDYPVYYNHSTKKIGLIESSGIALGMVEDIDNFLEVKEITMNRNDILLLYTDGATDAHNEDEEMFGIDRITGLVTQYSYMESNGLLNKIVEEINDFIGKKDQYDDITLLALKVK